MSSENMGNTSLAIILVAILEMSLIVPAVFGISLLQQANAAISGQNGKEGYKDCGPYRWWGGW
jgi:hypothetical protein